MYSGVISIFSERIKKGLPITIYGDGQQTRDFVNVRDVVSANLLAMTTVKIVQNVKAVKRESDLNESCKDGSANSTFNEGSARFNERSVSTSPDASGRFAVFNAATARQTSLLDLIAVLGEICGKVPEVKFAAARAGDIQHSLADVSKGGGMLGYQAKVGLSEGLSQLIM